MAKIPVSVLGPGAAGQEFMEAIPENHPDFEIVEIRGHSTAGKLLGDLGDNLIVNVSDRLKNIRIKPMPDSVESLDPGIGMYCSALAGDKNVIKKIEGICASEKPTFSTTSAWRYEDDVGIFIPELNSHLIYSLISQQRANHRWEGFECPGPNCTSMGPVMSLGALGLNTQNIESITLSSYQAVSGAGREAVVEWLRQRETGEIVGEDKKQFDRNVIPKIDGEIAKVQKEMRKILTGPNLKIDARCIRVPVEYGHIVSMFVRTKEVYDISEIPKRIDVFNDQCKRNLGNLFSSPEKTIELSGEYGPQPLRDIEKYGGMCTFIGQIGPLDSERGLACVVGSNNLKKGAAKGSVQLAEYLHRERFF
jgi:aspartate-semialdehyde dehydrogenase